MRVKCLRVKARVKICTPFFCMDFSWKSGILHAIYSHVRAAMPVACTVGGQCLDVKQNMHSKSYISLYKLYKRKKKLHQKRKKNHQHRQQQNNAEINWNTIGGRFACTCVHPLSDNSVGASDLMTGNQKLA